MSDCGDYCVLTENRLQMYLQPIFGFDEKKFIKAEALARMVNLSTNTIAYPHSFLNDPLLSHVGLFKEGFLQVVNYLSVIKDFEISINLNIDLLPSVIDCIESTIKAEKNIDPSRIIIELLENENKIALPFNELKRLKKIGFKIAMDDFGAGYSNIHRAAIVDFDYIKIDKKIMDGLKKNKVKSIKLIENIVKMNDDLGCKTIIEGVETFAEMEIARLSGAEYAQGYCFAKPMPFNDFLLWVKK